MTSPSFLPLLYGVKKQVSSSPFVAVPFPQLPELNATKPVKSSSVSLYFLIHFIRPPNRNSWLSFERKQKMKNSVLSLIKEDGCSVCVCVCEEEEEGSLTSVRHRAINTPALLGCHWLIQKLVSNYYSLHGCVVSFFSCCWFHGAPVAEIKRASSNRKSYKFFDCVGVDNN